MMLVSEKMESAWISPESISVVYLLGMACAKNMCAMDSERY